MIYSAALQVLPSPPSWGCHSLLCFSFYHLHLLFSCILVLLFFSFPPHFIEKILQWFPEKDTYTGSTFLKLCIFENDFILPPNFNSSLSGYKIQHWRQFSFTFLKGLLHCFLAPSAAVVESKSITESWSYAWWTDFFLLWTFLESSLCSQCFGNYSQTIYWIIFCPLFSLFVHLVFGYCTSQIGPMVFLSFLFYFTFFGPFILLSGRILSSNHSIKLNF